MTQMFEKQAAFTKKATDLPDVPSPNLTPAEIKDYFQNSSNELLVSFNKVVDTLNQPKLWTEDKLADEAVTRRIIKPGAVGWEQLDPAISSEPTTVFGVQAKLSEHDAKLLEKVNKGDMEQQALQKVAIDMSKGLPVTIDCRGDSTYQGITWGGSVANPAPAVLQDALQTYYNNPQINVINNGIGGNHTTNALRTWDSAMRDTPSHIVYFNYGINDQAGANPPGANDPAINAEQYRQNLREMITIARKRGKVVIMETPNVITQDAVNSNQQKAENTKQFAEVMRQVARELNVPLVDSYYWTSLMLAHGTVASQISDGVHPSQEMYTAKGLLMAAAIIQPEGSIINGETIIPATIPLVKSYGGWVGIAKEEASIVGEGLFGHSMRIPVFVGKSGLDIYLSFPVYSGASSDINVVVDNQSISTISLKDNGLNSPFAVDQEVMVIENAKPGFHLIELNAGTNDFGLYYIRSYNTRKRKTTVGGYASGKIRNLVLSDFEITTSQAGESHLLTDIPTSRVIKEIEIEVEAALAKNEGFFLFGHKMSGTGNQPRGGLVLFLESVMGYLTVAEGGNSSYTTSQTIETVDYSGASHRYKVKVSTSGLVTIYVDGIQKGTYQQQYPHIGGFFGFYKGNLGTTRIGKVYLN